MRDALHARKTICMLVMNAMDVMDDPRVRREAEAASRAGYDVLVITRSFDPELPTFECRNGFSVIRVRSFLPRIFTPRRNAPRILKELETLFHAFIANFQIASQALKQKAAIYHAHEIGALPVGYLLKRVRGAKLVYDAHEFYTESSSLREASRWFRWMFEQVQRYILRRVDAVITVSEMIGEEMVARYKCQRPFIVRNCPSLIQGVDVEGDPLRKVLGLEKAKKIVLYQGLYAPYRGLKQLVESARFIQDGVVVFRGWGELEGELKRRTRELDLTDKVFFVKPVPLDQVTRAAAEADIGVVPIMPDILSYRYCAPNKLFEYFAMGKPAVASALPGLVTTFDSDCVLYFQPDDEKDLAARVLELYHSPEKRASLASHAQEFYRNCQWQVMKYEYLKVYEECIKS